MKKAQWITGGIGMLIIIISVTFLLGTKYEKLVFNRMVDGDTFWVTNLRDGSEWKVRLWGVDAPDQGKCYFKESTVELEKMIVDKKLKFEKMGMDDYGRILAKVYVDGVSMEEQLVAKGAAAAYDAKDVHDDLRPSKEYFESLKMIEEKAKTDKQGVWSDECNKKPLK